MLVAGTRGGIEPEAEPCGSFLGTAKLCKRLCRHLVGRDVVRVVLEQRGELSERKVGVSGGDVRHREAVAGESVCGVLLKYLG